MPATVQYVLGLLIDRKRSDLFEGFVVSRIDLLKGQLVVDTELECTLALKCPSQVH